MHVCPLHAGFTSVVYRLKGQACQAPKNRSVWPETVVFGSGAERCEFRTGDGICFAARQRENR
jgi:hypothetical protein